MVATLFGLVFNFALAFGGTIWFLNVQHPTAGTRGWQRIAPVTEIGELARVDTPYGVTVVVILGVVVDERYRNTTGNGDWVKVSGLVPSWAFSELERSEAQEITVVGYQSGFPLPLFHALSVEELHYPEGGYEGYVRPVQVKSAFVEFPELAPLTGGVTKFVWPQRLYPLGVLANTLVYAAIAFVLMSILGAGRSARRVRRGRCPRCDYDLAGNLTPGCPECGWNREPATA